MMKDFSRKSIEETPRIELLKELKNITSLAFPCPVAKQNAEKLVFRLRYLDGKIDRTEYEKYWSNLKLRGYEKV